MKIMTTPLGRRNIGIAMAIATVAIATFLAAINGLVKDINSRNGPPPPHAPRASGSDDDVRRVHITGCEGGELVVPVVKLWDSPAKTRVLGQLSGDGREDQGLRCQGSVVVIHKTDGEMFEVEAVIGGQRGWVSALFIGRDAPNAR
jgi:hypothetical protein